MNNYERLEKDGKIKALVYNLCTSTLEEVKIMYKIPKNYSVVAWLTESCGETYVKLSDVTSIIEEHIAEIQQLAEKKRGKNVTNYEWLVTNGKLADFLKMITNNFYSDRKKNVFEKAAEYLQKPYTVGKDIKNDT